MSEADGRIGPVAIDREYSRRSFLKTAAWATAALSAAGIGGFGLSRRANAQAAPYTTYQPLSATDILAFAYELELLEGTFYAQGVQAGIFSGATLAVVTKIRDDEMAHVDALASTLQKAGAAVPATPNFTFPGGTFTDPTAFLKLAATFEPVGIGAYQGAAPAIMGTDYLLPALEIHSAECRHWNAIKVLQGIVPPNNVAFEEALPLSTVQQAVAPFGITG